jgi:hypothetical protein
MSFQQGENSYDITFICMSTIGLILLIGYIAFAYFVAHKGDFYNNRRWKAAIWLASIFGVVLSASLLLFSIIAIISSAPGKNIFEVIRRMLGVFSFTLAFIIPFVFIVCVGTHHQLKLRLNSDDYLDKIWKDPNKGHKSPIQEI